MLNQETMYTILMLVVMMGLVYFLTIRPQKKQQKEMDEMRNSLQVGDEIITIGGIVGKIVILKEDYLTIETAGEKTRLEFTKWAIGAKKE